MLQQEPVLQFSLLLDGRCAFAFVSHTNLGLYIQCEIFPKSQAFFSITHCYTPRVLPLYKWDICCMLTALLLNRAVFG